MHKFRLNRKPDDGFTLVELLIVVAIIGIIAAIAIPNLLSAIQRGKQKRTMGDIKTLGSALEAYETDANTYALIAFGAIGSPGVSPTGILPFWGNTTTSLDPDYQRLPIFKDGWWSSQGASLNPGSGLLMYGSFGGPPSEDYVLCSYGKNGLIANPTPGAQPAGCAAITSLNMVGGDGSTFDCDLVMVNGQFNQQPSGKQRNTAGC